MKSTSAKLTKRGCILELEGGASLCKISIYQIVQAKRETIHEILHLHDVIQIMRVD